MIVYLFVTCVAVFLGYSADLSRRAVSQPAGRVFAMENARGTLLSKTALFLLLVTLFIPAALRQATGNDYMRYVEIYHLAAVGARVPTEEGFNLFVRAVYALCGYENYLLVFALFSLATTALFLLAIRRQARFFGFSIYLFMMFGYYFQSYNTVRYYLALAAAFYALYYFLEKEYVPFVLIILLASTFHKSVLIVLLLYPVASLAWKKWHAAAALLLGGSLLVFHEQWLALMLRFYPLWDDTEDLAASGGFSYGNIVKCALVLALAAGIRYIAAGKEPGGSFYDTKVLFGLKCTAMALWIYLFGSFIPEVSRICYYLTIPQVLLLPELLDCIPKSRLKMKKLLTALVAAAALASFAMFLRKADDSRIRILPYKTFLFHELPGTPSRSIE